MLRTERAEFFFGLYPTPGTLTANEARKMSNKFVGARRQFGGQLSPMPLPSYVTQSSHTCLVKKIKNPLHPNKSVSDNNKRIIRSLIQDFSEKCNNINH